MPEKETAEKARQDEHEGKSPSTQAGEFVHEEIDHVKKGKHGARSTKQAIAIGLSKARRAGVKLPPPKGGSGKTKKQAEHDSEKGGSGQGKAPSRARSRATTKALRREGHEAAAHESLSKQARSNARHRGDAGRKAAAAKAVRTKEKTVRRARKG